MKVLFRLLLMALLVGCGVDTPKEPTHNPPLQTHEEELRLFNGLKAEAAEMDAAYERAGEFNDARGKLIAKKSKELEDSGDKSVGTAEDRKTWWDNARNEHKKKRAILESRLNEQQERVDAARTAVKS